MDYEKISDLEKILNSWNCEYSIDLKFDDDLKISIKKEKKSSSQTIGFSKGD